MRNHDRVLAARGDHLFDRGGQGVEIRREVGIETRERAPAIEHRDRELQHFAVGRRAVRRCVGRDGIGIARPLRIGKTAVDQKVARLERSKRIIVHAKGAGSE